MIPKQKQVLLKVDLEPDKVTETGIHLVNFNQRREDKGLVISIGNGVRQMEVGTIVKFYYGAGYKATHKKQDSHLLIDSKNILGTIL